MLSLLRYLDHRQPRHCHRVPYNRFIMYILVQGNDHIFEFLPTSRIDLHVVRPMTNRTCFNTISYFSVQHSNASNSSVISNSYSAYTIISFCRNFTSTSSSMPRISRRLCMTCSDGTKSSLFTYFHQ